MDGMDLSWRGELRGWDGLELDGMGFKKRGCV